jgi:hypothetical protein
VVLASYGYTRVFQAPKDVTDATDARGHDVTLRSFPEQQDGKIPIYIARNTTEALLYELDPWFLIAFICINTGAKVSASEVDSYPKARTWLMEKLGILAAKGESHLRLRPLEKAAGVKVDEMSALTFGVLHTFSHVMKATAHAYVGIDNDMLAEYLFPLHTAGLLYVSAHVQFTMGGIDSAFRSSFGQWLESARDFAGHCQFDPVCSESGGACLACLYPKFGCGHFNRTLSRAFLFGGLLRDLGRPIVGFWQLPVAKMAASLHPKPQEAK